MALGEKPPASNGPFRGGKGSLYEGGVRVPAIVNWPARLKPGICREPMHMVDIMPTVLALAAAHGADVHPFDGKDIWATLASGKPSPHDEISDQCRGDPGAIRKGNWKLVRMATFPGKTELYNLADDPQERTTSLSSIPRSPPSSTRAWSPMPVR